MVALKVAALNVGVVKQARKAKGWAIDDFRWLEEASKILGTSWEETGYFADGISEGTWKRFLSGKYAVNVNAFQAFCQVLGLKWQEIVDRQNRQDWGEEIDVAVFFGRDAEIKAIEKYIIEDKCRLITLLGMGGIGKTSLSIKAARSLANQFEFVIWRSLRNAPSLDQILTDLIQFIGEQKCRCLPDILEQKISLLLKYLRSSRCLLILDNVESILQSGGDRAESSLVINYQHGYQNYGQFFKAIAETNHQSCTLLTSREQPPSFSTYEGESLPVRTLQIKGLSNNVGQKILHSKGNFSGLKTTGNTLVEHYGGNPLALKIVSSTIRDFFAGNVTDFIATLQTDTFIFDDIRDLLQKQFRRLTVLERQIMYWLAIEREPVSVRVLQQNFIVRISLGELLQSLASLQKRSFVEKSDNYFSLQTVVMEYIIYELIGKVTTEINTQAIELLNQIALAKSQSKDYIRESQETQILKPIADKLLSVFGTPQQIERQAREILQSLHSSTNRTLKRGYLSGNLINILCQLNLDLSNFDFSGLTVWQANLQEKKLHNVNFTGADLSKSVFTETLGNILSATFSPDGTIVATCDTDCQIRLWEVATGKLLVICKGHSNWVRSVAFSPDGKTIASGSADRTVKFWLVKDGSCIKTCRGHKNEVFSVAYSPDNQTLVSASGDNILRIWEFRTGKCIGTCSGHSNCVRSVVFSPDGQTLASGSDDCTIRIWNAKTGDCLDVLSGHQGWVRSVAFSPDSTIIASGSGDRTVKLWSATSGECLATYEEHSGSVSAVAFSSDGVTLASGSGDRTVRLWNYHTHTCIKTIYGHANQIFSLAFSPQGRTVVCVSLDRTVRIWDCVTSRCLKTWQGSTDWVFPVAYSPDGNLIASGSSDRRVRIWDWKHHRCMRTLSGHEDLVCGVAFHPNGQIVASSSRDNTVRLWNIETGECVRILAGHEDWVYSVAFNPDGKTLASGSADKTARIWDYQTGQCLRNCSCHSDQVWSVAFSPNGKILATGNTDRQIGLWDLARGECWQTLTGHQNRIKSVAFSPQNENLLASGSTDNTVALWDIRQGKRLKTLVGHDNWVFAVAISPDGQTLASASHDRTVRIWDLPTGECRHICQGHQHLVSSVAFHPHEAIIASGSQDQTIRLWDTNTGKCLQVLRAARLYEGMNITGVKGLTPAQKATLKTLGAIELVPLRLSSK